MAMADGLVDLVPFLRRCARALTGNQATGDECVITALEHLIADKNSAVPARIGLYRAVLAQVDALEARSITLGLPTPAMEPVQRNLAGLTPMGRQAFLLVAMEEFSIADAAMILQLSEEETGVLLEGAHQDIASQIATDVVIIEDEPLIALDLQDLLKGLGHRVVGIARTEREAIAAVARTKPGLVLADVQLADGSSGLDAVNEILRSFAVPVIFITAYPEKLLTGTKPEPTFLIRKPYQVEAVRAVVSQALFFDVRGRPAPPRLRASP
jgi:CheY-like chemotaxis protein